MLTQKQKLTNTTPMIMSIYPKWFKIIFGITLFLFLNEQSGLCRKAGHKNTDWNKQMAKNNSDNVNTISYGGNGFDVVSDVLTTRDGGQIIIGHSSSTEFSGIEANNKGGTDIWVVKLDAFGRVAWQRLYGGDKSDFGTCVRQTNDGGFILAGHSYSSNNGNITNTNKGGCDIWLAKLDPAGNILWDTSIGGDNADLAVTIKAIANDTFLLLANTTSSLKDAKGKVTDSNADMMVFKIDQYGAVLNQHRIVKPENQVASALALTRDAGYIISGTTVHKNITKTRKGKSRNTDVCVVKFDRNNVLIWERTYGGPGNERGYDIAEMSDKGYTVTGYFSATNSNMGLVEMKQKKSNYEFKISKDGVLEWSTFYESNMMRREQLQLFSKATINLENREYYVDNADR